MPSIFFIVLMIIGTIITFSTKMYSMSLFFAAVTCFMIWLRQRDNDKNRGIPK